MRYVAYTAASLVLSFLSMAFLRCNWSGSYRTRRVGWWGRLFLRTHFFFVQMCWVLLLLPYQRFEVYPEFFENGPPRKRKRAEALPAVPRTRRKVSSIMNELGPAYVPRAYRLRRNSFAILHKVVQPFLRSETFNKKHRNGASNGLISSTMRLSIG